MGSEEEQHRGDPRPGEVVAGKYRVEALIGQGAMGSVYAARNLGTGKRVALKWLLAERQADTEMIARFEREARAAGRIDHPNVVSVYDVGRDGASNFLVMELLKGYSLYDLMQQGPLPPEAAIQLLMPAMRGIAAAHAHQVIHRDIKPENLFICIQPDGSIRTTKVLDFGVSKMTDELREGLSVTRTGMIIGTPYYMSPEQVRGGHEIDHRIDIYAVGVILYELIAGRPPFVAEHYSALVLQVATGTPPSLREFCPDVPAALCAVIEKAMARECADRYQDIESLGVALEPFSDGVSFRVQNPEWTQKIKLPPGSTPPPPLVGESGPVLISSMVDTHVAPSSSEGPNDSSPVAWQEAGPSAEHVAVTDSQSPVLPQGPLVKVVATGAVFLVALALAFWISTATEDVPTSPSGTAPVSATPEGPEGMETPPAEGTATQVAEPTVVPAEPEVVEPREAAPVAAEAAASPPSARMRRGMRATRPSSRMSTEASMMTSPRTHRAGALSAEDF